MKLQNNYFYNSSLKTEREI